MNDKLCFVQFIHPGGEHRPDDGLNKEWNTNVHKRKFLRQPARYITNGRVKKGKVLFWGEWEPESKAERIEDPINHGPHYIYKPYYIVPKSYEGLQNTDPFVFGKQFHYTGCQQHRGKVATQLRYLLQGSIILFGSCIGRSSFVLDTVFVVDHWIDHSRANYREVLAGAISQKYCEVTISPWYKGSCAPAGSRNKGSCAPADPVETWRLYFGVRHDKPLQGMYSFFPCQRYKAKSKGFARPRIRLPHRITDNLNQGMRLTEQRSLDEMKSLWGRVAKQVKEKGLGLGVYAALPERRKRLGSVDHTLRDVNC